MKLFKSIMFFLTIGFFYSCVADGEKSVNKEDMDKETIQKIETMLMTPDSLRSAEDRALCQKMEAMVYENCIIKNGRIETIISKEKIKAMGLPEVCYDMLKKDLYDTNNLLDTTSFFPKQMILNSFRESQEKYMTRKELQHQNNHL